MKYYNDIYGQLSIAENIDLWPCANLLMYTSKVYKRNGRTKETNRVQMFILNETMKKRGQNRVLGIL